LFLWCADTFTVEQEAIFLTFDDQLGDPMARAKAKKSDKHAGLGEGSCAYFAPSGPDSHQVMMRSLRQCQRHSTTDSYSALNGVLAGEMYRDMATVHELITAQRRGYRRKS
jgi:hypothetical protein